MATVSSERVRSALRSKYPQRNLDIKAAARRSERFGGIPTCKYWLAGRCNRNPCRFLHSVTPSSCAAYYSSNNPYKYTRKPHSSVEKTIEKPRSVDERTTKNPRFVDERMTEKPHSSDDMMTEKPRSCEEKTPKYNDSKTVMDEKNEVAGDVTVLVVKNEVEVAGDVTTLLSKAPQQLSRSICKYWVNDNCVHGEQCQDLHSLFYGNGVSKLAKLHEHKKVITGITLPVGLDKLYSGSTDGTLRTWDCHTGQCANVINLGAEITSLISEGPWIFAGMMNAVKAWNVQATSDYTLDGPKGQVLSMVAYNDILFAGAEDGVISAWRGSSEAKSPFELVASLSGHTKPVVCLTIGAKMLFSGSMDHTINVWDLHTLEFKMTLTGHTDVVTSLICWDNYLLSSSCDCTIKVWAATKEGTLEVVYAHTEEHGVVALHGLTDAEDQHILLCSCRDNSVRLYDLPSFSERGRLFAKEEVRSLEIGPDGLFFTGDRTGLLTVWKWSGAPKVAVTPS